MATESLVRMVESRGPGERQSSMNNASFTYPLDNMESEELGVLLQHRSGKGQHRSGSAPPSMEGSFAAIENLLARNDSDLNATLDDITNAIENCESEEQWRSDPAYLEYYFSNVNLNPRLPPPLMSRENRRLVRHIGLSLSDNNQKPNSFENVNDGLLQPRGILSTHTEEPEEERTSQQDSYDGSESGASNSMLRQKSSSLSGRHKSLVDLIQEDFPRTPSPMYSQSHVPNHAAIEPDLRSLTLDDPYMPPESNKGEKDCPDAYAPRNGEPSQSSRSRMSDVEVVGHLSTVSRHEYGNEGNSRNRDQYMHGSKNRQQQSTHQHNEMNRSQGFQTQASLNQLHISSVDVHPIQNSPGLAPPLYASAAAYMSTMNPYFANLQQPGFFSSQYGIGGYSLNPPIYPYMPGYSPGSTISPFSLGSGPSFNTHGEGIPLMGEMQHLNKYYAHQPSLPQPHVVDPMHLQFFQPPFDRPYVGGGQYGRVAPSRVTRTDTDVFSSHKIPIRAPFVGDQRFHVQTDGYLNSPGSRKGDMSGTGLIGIHPNMGFVTQYQGSPFNSPIMPVSQMGGLQSPERRNEVRYTHGPSRGSGGYSTWHGMRRGTTFDDSPKRSFLEELKSNNSRRFEISDIAGRIIEFRQYIYLCVIILKIL